MNEEALKNKEAKTKALRDKYLKHMESRKERLGSKSTDDKVFDEVEGGKSIDLFEDDREKKIEDMDIEDLSSLANKFNMSKPMPTAKDIPEGTDDRRGWIAENTVHPITGQTMSSYMSDNGLSFGEANSKFKKEIKISKEQLMAAIKKEGNTQIGVLELAVTNDDIGEFLGVTDEHKHFYEYWEKTYTNGGGTLSQDTESTQSQFGSKGVRRTSINQVVTPKLDSFMAQLGYPRVKYAAPWNTGLHIKYILDEEN